VNIRYRYKYIIALVRIMCESVEPHT